MKQSRLPRLPARVRGFTLVEVMVALVIGLLVSLVIGQIFVGTRQSFNSQDDSARLQESMRFASQVLSRTVRFAGYRTNPTLDPATVFPKATAPAIDGVDNSPTAGLPSGIDPVKPTGSAPAAVPDLLSVRFQGDVAGPSGEGVIVDCVGNPVGFGAMAVNTFGVRPVTKPDGTASSSLFCSTDNGATWPANNELIADVDNMQVLYGVDSDNDGSANYYVRRTDVPDIDTIVAVRVWVLIRSSTATQPTVAPIVYSLAGVNYTYTDRFVRRVLYTTINLRNRTL